jgi:hypothetical protein
MAKAEKRLGWCKLSQAAAYCGVSKDCFKKWPGDGLRYVELESGLRLFKFEWLNEWLCEREVNPIKKVAQELLGKGEQ